MRATGLAVVALVWISAGSARADLFDIQEWYRRIETATRSLIGSPALDQDVIVPPGNIDPKMVRTPRTLGAMRIIPPPGAGGR